MATFKNLKDLEAYLKRNMHQVLKNSMELERELAEVMYKTVIDRVYNSYTSSPEEMDKRRGNNDGLSDIRNMIVTGVSLQPNGIVKVVFENIAEGRDTMEDTLLVDAFEQPSKNGHWNKQGEWSQDRSFINETAERIRQNPENVIAAIKQGLESIGFKVQ